MQCLALCLLTCNAAWLACVPVRLHPWLSEPDLLRSLTEHPDSHPHQWVNSWMALSSSCAFSSKRTCQLWWILAADVCEVL